MPPVEVERIVQLESGLTEVKADIHDIKGELRALSTEVVKEFRALNIRLAGRPSWAVTTIITLLSSAVAGLTVALATSF